MKLSQRQLLKICDRNVKRHKKADPTFNEKSYRNKFMNPKGRNAKDSTK